jgi:hypothetical protein
LSAIAPLADQPLTFSPIDLVHLTEQESDDEGGDHRSAASPSSEATVLESLSPIDLVTPPSPCVQDRSVFEIFGP